MSKIPSLSYEQIVRACPERSRRGLQRGGWVVVRQRGSHIRLHKRRPDRTLKLTVPAHRPVKRTTLARILKHAEMEVDRFLGLL